MQKAAQNHPQINRWRTEVGEDHPAGPLFSGGPFAESDMVGMDISNDFWLTNTAYCPETSDKFCG